MKQRSQWWGKGSMGLPIAVAGVWLGAAPAHAMDVSVDYDKQAQFSRCETYAWEKGQPAQNPLADKRIVEAIDAQLAGRGWKKVQANPGCYVIYQASVKEQKSLQVWGHGGRFIGGMGSVDVKTVVNGMLVVDIGDASTQQLIWRAVAKDTVSDKPEQNQKKLGQCMEKMFKDFPVPATKQ
jgi:hypothetical protein